MTSVNEIMKLAGRWRTANYAEREEARADLQAAVETVAAVVARKDSEIAHIKEVEFPKRLGNVTKPLIAERDALKAEVERLTAAVSEAERVESAMLTKGQAKRILDMALDLEKTGRIVSLSEGQERSDYVARNRGIQCALEDYLRDLTEQEPHARDAVTWTPETGYVFATAAAEQAERVEPEPVAWLYTHPNGEVQSFTHEPPPKMKEVCKPLYTTPPAAAVSEPLTDEQIATLCKEETGFEIEGSALTNYAILDFARAIEAAHGIGAKP